MNAAVLRGCLVVLTCAFLAGVPAITTGAASTTVVGATVPSATNLNAAGCASGTAGSTELGTIQPGSSAVATLDCSIVFGSSNDTSMLRMWQADRTGNGLVLAADGRLDTGFDTDGKVVTPVGAGAETAMDVAVQPDGKVVIAGEASSGGTSDFLVARYNVDGSLDTTFDGDGIAITPVLAAGDKANAVAIQPDGRIIAAGYAGNGTDDDLAFVRYQANGALDTTFDGDGKLVLPASAALDRVEDVALQADGRIVAVGRSNFDALLLRLTTAGALDTTFDGDGYRPESLGGSGLRAIAVQEDGAIVSGGFYYVGGYSDYLLFRHLPSGARDNSFDGDGRRNIAFSTDHDALHAISVLPDGRIVVAGDSWNGTNADFTVVRLAANGSPDATFDGDGIVTTPMADHQTAYSLMARADGVVMLAGYQGTDVLVARYRTDGSLDPSWSGDGLHTVDIVGNDAAEAIAQLADGKVLVAGSGNNGGDVILARFDATSFGDWASGTSDWSTGASMFGACLRSVAGASAVGAWTVDPDATCTGVNTDPWNRIQPVSSTSGATVARSTASGTVAATANVRFGARAAASQRPGAYRAEVVLEVVAPDA